MIVMTTPGSITKLKIGVVIQGPILSIGVTGENSELVKFDSSEMKELEKFLLGFHRELGLN